MAFLRYRRAAAVAAVLLASLAPRSGALTAGSATKLPSPGSLVDILSSTVRPPRDLYALTARLKLHSIVPIDPYINHTPTDYAVGSITSFYIGNGNQNGYTLRPARLLLKTAHAYYYGETNQGMDMQALARSAQTFEHKTYVNDHAIFGREWTPGADDDVHITIFNGQVPDVAGYFSGEDLFPRVVNAYSNQRKMIYMNLGDVQPGTSRYDSVLAHEFQHMIHFNVHPADDAWINEGSSMLAEVLNGYGDGGYASVKASSPQVQLNAWDVNNSGPYYGGGLMWMLYLYEHYGGNRLTRAELADRNLSNMALFDDVLAKLGYHLSANDVFADWVIANLINDRSIDGGTYGYTHTDVKASVVNKVPAQFTRQDTLPQYSASYTTVDTGGAPTSLHFSGAPTVSLLDTVAPASGMWWSNRGDGVDTTLTTPSLNLRSVRSATLRYKAWFDLEKDWDYAYVEVSTDGGKTWTSLRTPHTVSSNPNGSNIGNGYSGSSCTGAAVGAHCWLDEKIDLTPYVGKSVQVRFEQVTDDVYNGQGMAVSQVRVPEIGFSGEAAPDEWHTAGWVHTGNTLAERWIVQAVISRSHHAPVVDRMPVDAAGNGTLAIPAGASQVTVAVSPVAPLTTVANNYALSGGP